MAELWGLVKGLKFASQLQISHLQIELDAKIVVDMLINEKSNYCLLNP